MEPLKLSFDSLEPKYRYSWRHFVNKDGKDVALYYQIHDHDKIQSLIQEIYEGLTNPKQVRHTLLNVTENWLIENGDETDIPSIKNAMESFLKSLQEEIKPQTYYVLISGLTCTQNVQIGACTLTPIKDSPLEKLIARGAQKFGSAYDLGSLNSSDSYFSVRVSGQNKTAIDIALEEVQLSLNIIRLFLSSYFMDENDRSIVHRFGITGTFLADEDRIVYSENLEQPEDKRGIGLDHSKRIVQKTLFHTPENQKRVADLGGLTLVNRILTERFTNDLVPRLLKAILWFGKGSSTRKVADSYMMYAISVECLFSEGRTSENRYSQYVSALTALDSEALIHPIQWRLSPTFAENLRQASSLKERQLVVKKRFDELFRIRNHVAHGKIFDDEIQQDDLVDFETLVRGTILQYIDHNWGSFKLFKQWFKNNFDFSIEEPTFTNEPRNYILNYLQKWFSSASIFIGKLKR